MVKCLILALLVLLVALVPEHARADKYDDLSIALGDRITRVPEFTFIREEAEKLGVKVYLFGGTAASYAHYVRQDLAREAGDTRYPAHLYDYDYTKIFRSTQDLDVVIDGSPEQAAELERILKAKFPHFLGDKEAKWEVRPLRVARGEKEAILGNPNFLNQHTDSHSTGMVEITPALGGNSVKDVRDWNATEPQFLKDVVDQKLHYYFNPLHETTERAAKGLNPPILSVIRYLTKAFQYDLEISGEDRKRIKEIIGAFDRSEIDNDYLKQWVEKNGKKLFQHSVDLEKSWQELDSLGLRKKLIGLQNNPREKDSLAWLLEKEPLRSFPVGQGDGKTAAAIAKELKWKELVVAHETNGYLAFESLTRSRAGDLNAFISRGGKEGEYALHGDGFYTKVGRSGARNTGFTIRMKLKPEAREGKDFLLKRFPGETYVVLLNKSCVEVIPEEINVSLLAYLKMLAEGKDFSADDRALLEAFKRKVGRTGLMEASAEKEVAALAQKKMTGTWRPLFWQEYLRLPLSAEHPEIMLSLIEKAKTSKVVAKSLAEHAFTQAHWQKHSRLFKAFIEAKVGNPHLATFLPEVSSWENRPEMLDALVKAGNADYEIAKFMLPKPGWEKHPEILATLMERKYQPRVDLMTILALAYPHWQGYPEFVEALIKRGKNDETIVTQLLAEPHWQRHPHLIDLMIEKNNAKLNLLLVRHALTQPALSGQAKFLEKILEGGQADNELVQYLFTQKNWQQHPKFSSWMKTILERGQADESVVDFLLSQERLQHHLDWAETIFRRGKADSSIVNTLITEEPWRHRTDWVETMLKRGHGADLPIILKLLTTPEWQNHPEYIDTMLARGLSDKEILTYLLPLPQWEHRSDWVDVLLKRGNLDLEIGLKILPKAYAQAHPEWMSVILERGTFDSGVLHLLKQPHWRERPEFYGWLETLILRGKLDNKISQSFLSSLEDHAGLLRALGGKPLTVENVRTEIRKGFSLQPKSGAKTRAGATCPAKFAEL